MSNGWHMIRHAPQLPRLHLSLASPVFGLARAAQIGMAVVTVLCVGFTGWCWWEARSLHETSARYGESVTRVREMNREFTAQMKQDGLTLTQGDIAELYKRVEFTNGLIKERAFSWTRLLSDLEAAMPPRVSIASVRLSVKDSTVQLKGRVLTLRDLNALVNNLENHGGFGDVKVSSHRFQDHLEIDKKTGSRRGSIATANAAQKKRRKVVEFELTVGYQPAV